VFAPRSGPYLFAGAVAIVLVALVDALGRLPVSWAFSLLLVVVGALWAFLAWFFRDPERVAGPEIVSAADGRVLSVGTDAGRVQVAVFMKVTDVHVNRMPMDATVLSVRDGGSGFRPAFAVDASHNVRRHYDLSTAIGPVEVVQMTGTVARRLVSFVEAGGTCSKGERFGMIVLGSRVDVFLPADRVEATIAAGQRVVAGVTTIARVRP
jgi:phosphatidylserine decarboxylase